MITGVEPTPELGESSFKNKVQDIWRCWRRHININCPSVGCAALDAQMQVSDSPGCCWANYALWWTLKWGNLRFKVLKIMSNRRGGVRICLGLCLGDWKTLAHFLRFGGHCKAIGGFSMAVASGFGYKAQPKIIWFCDFLGSSPALFFTQNT